jgi:hypothetical protein
MRFMIVFYTLLLRLYPRPYRQQFSEEMLTVFAEAIKNASNWHSVVGICLRELRDLPICLIREHRMLQMPMRYKVLIGLIIASGVVAGGLSMYLWGYLFAPPSIQPLTSQMRDIEGVSGFRLDEAYELTSFKLKTVPHVSDPFIPIDRPFDALTTMFPVPDLSYSPEPQLLEAIEDALEQRQVERGWINPQYNIYPTGYIFDGVGLSGEKVVLVSLTSTQISNDDYTYYEFLFRQEASGQLTELNRIHFNYQVAGIEGITFPVLWIACMLPLLLLYLPYLLAVTLRTNRRQLRFS